jgi:uncharacterized protein (TIGR03067 family)
MAKCVTSGSDLPQQYCKMGRRLATADETTVTMGPQTILKARYAVDRSCQPKAMNYVLAHGPGAGKVQLGIYDFTGGTLTTCFKGPGEDRPTDFSTAAGDGKTLVVWERLK